MRRLTSLLALLATAACGGSEEAPAAETAPVAAVTLTPSDIATPRQMELSEGVSISGSLEPSQTVVVDAQVGGRLRRVLVDRGTRVNRGQLLAQIEAGDEVANLDQGRGLVTLRGGSHAIVSARV